MSSLRALRLRAERCWSGRTGLPAKQLHPLKRVSGVRIPPSPPAFLSRTSRADLFRTRVRLPPPPPFNILNTKGEVLDAGTVPSVSTKKCDHSNTAGVARSSDAQAQLLGDEIEERDHLAKGGVPSNRARAPAPRLSSSPGARDA